MKTMTCQQLGGKCDQKLSADTWDQMGITGNYGDTPLNYPLTPTEGRNRGLSGVSP